MRPPRRKRYSQEQTDRYLSQQARWRKGMSLTPKVKVENEEKIEERCDRQISRETTHIYTGRNGLEYEIPVSTYEHYQDTICEDEQINYCDSYYVGSAQGVIYVIWFNFTDYWFNPIGNVYWSTSFRVFYPIKNVKEYKFNSLSKIAYSQGSRQYTFRANATFITFSNEIINDNNILGTARTIDTTIPRARGGSYQGNDSSKAEIISYGGFLGGNPYDFDVELGGLFKCGSITPRRTNWVLVEKTAEVGECNCPDKTKKQQGTTNSPYPSEWSDRNWQDSDAGTRGHCKHEYASYNAVGDPLPEPED
jgi:hypothetical protein